MPATSPIIVLDSGLGGLTVVRALRETMPAEDILYFGDTARLPYGSKTAGTVAEFVKQIIAYLLPYQPKHVVIACNTATALALPETRAAFPGLAISGVIEPGADAAADAAWSFRSPVVGVLATEATIRSQAYDDALRRRLHSAQLLLRAAPLLVPIIEEGRASDDPLVHLALRQYLEPMLRRPLDVLLLGCTHYPVFRELIEEMMGPGVAVIDSARQCAQDIAARLATRGLAKGWPMSAGDRNGGSLRCFVTDDPARFQRLAPRFLGIDIDAPTWVSPQDLYADRTFAREWAHA